MSIKTKRDKLIDISTTDNKYAKIGDKNNEKLKVINTETLDNIILTQNDLNYSDKEKINQMINVSIDNSEKSPNKNINYNNILKKIRLNTETSKENIKNKNFLKNKSNSINAKNLKIRLTPITPGVPKPLDKKEMFDYFKYGICDRDPQRKSQDKVALVFHLFYYIL